MPTTCNRRCTWPLVRALILLTTAGYAGLIFISGLVVTSHISVALRLSPALLALPIAMVVARTRHPLILSSLTLLSLIELEIGINLNGIGPLPILLVGHVDDIQLLRCVAYMGLTFCLAMLLRGFMRRDLLKQLRLQRQLHRQGTTDGLTGLLLRNRFFELAQRSIKQAQRTDKPVCMLYLDTDHFKHLNDNHGHAAGDEALMALTDCLHHQVCGSDLVGRVGVEEFAMLLPGLDLQQASTRTEQLRKAAHGVLRPDGPMTISIGIAEVISNEGVEALLARADKAMRQAKKSGRDEVVAAADGVTNRACA